MTICLEMKGSVNSGASSGEVTVRIGKEFHFYVKWMGPPLYKART
jgi:hypothetical protein